MSVTVAAGTNIALSIFYSQMIQYMWGMINSLQMIVLTVLFDVNMPDELFETLKMIMQYTNLDIV